MESTATIFAENECREIYYLFSIAINLYLHSAAILPPSQKMTIGFEVSRSKPYKNENSTCILQVSFDRF
jgi:hypothetical protein